MDFDIAFCELKPLRVEPCSTSIKELSGHYCRSTNDLIRCQKSFSKQELVLLISDVG